MYLIDGRYTYSSSREISGIKLKSQLGATLRLPFDLSINEVHFDEVKQQHRIEVSRLSIRWSR